MPTYKYRREDGTTFELVQRMSEKALTVCPDTGQAVKIVPTGGSGVIYKGSGWTAPSNKKETKFNVEWTE